MMYTSITNSIWGIWEGPSPAASPFASPFAPSDPLSSLSVPWEADPCSLCLPRLLDLWVGSLLANGRAEDGRRVCPGPGYFLLTLAVEGFLARQPHSCLAMVPLQGSIHCRVPLLTSPLPHQTRGFREPLLAVLSGPCRPLLVLLSVPTLPSRIPPLNSPQVNPLLAQAAITKYHKLAGFNHRHLFLTVLEAGSPRSGCQWI